MKFGQKLTKELLTLFWSSLYFLSWFGALMVIKILLLREYEIEFVGLTIVVMGTLVVTKVVLLLEYVPVPYTRGRPAWIEVLIRTILYLSVIFIILVIEKIIESKQEYGGVMASLKNLEAHADLYHVLVNIISIFGALLFFNIWSVFKQNYGKGLFIRLMKSPLPDKNQDVTISNIE